MPCENNCRVGSCPHCSSSCKRCGCACDGLPPEVKLKRKRGKPPKTSNSAQKAKRSAAKKARVSISASIANENELLHSVEAIEDKYNVDKISGLWNFFRFSLKRKKGLPSMDALKEDKELYEKDKSGMSTVISVCADATKAVATTLYPANPSYLLQEIGKQLNPVKSTTEARAYRKLEKACIQAYMATPRGSIERRIRRAVVVKGISESRRNELKEDEELSLSHAMILPSYHDYNTIIEGQKLERNRIHIQRFDSDAMMREELQRRYPYRYSIPGENEIRIEIQKLFYSQKRGASGQVTMGQPTPTGVRGRMPTIPQPYLTKIEEIFEEIFASRARENIWNSRNYLERFYPKTSRLVEPVEIRISE